MFKNLSLVLRSSIHFLQIRSKSSVRLFIIFPKRMRFRVYAESRCNTQVVVTGGPMDRPYNITHATYVHALHVLFDSSASIIIAFFISNVCAVALHSINYNCSLSAGLSTIVFF